MSADQLHEAIVELDRRIQLARIQKCCKHFWCCGHRDTAKTLAQIKKQQSFKLKNAMALMAAEKLAADGLSDDVLRMIVCAARETEGLPVALAMHS